ncbi:MAG: hypothetical protein R6T91_05840 [Bacteroidales bacterium]
MKLLSIIFIFVITIAACSRTPEQPDIIFILTDQQSETMMSLSTGSMLGISYDLTTSPLGAEGRSAGTFEVFLRYCFDISIPPVLDGHRTVRFL